MDNVKRAEAYHNSRLGQILLDRGYITEDQLGEAVRVQAQTGQKLGEILMQKRQVSRWQLRRSLSSQTRLRAASSLAVVLISPIQELADAQHLGQAESTARINEDLALIIEPLLNTLTTSDGLQGLVYDPNDTRMDICVDGSIRLKIKTLLGELQFDGLRLRTSTDWDFEQLSLEDVDLSQTKMSIRAML